MREISISFLRSSILFDIANGSWIEGEALQTDDERLRRVIQDVCDDGNISRVTKILNLAYFEAVEMLYPYSKQGFETLARDIETVSDDEDIAYTIQLQLPEGFSATTANLLDKLVQEYVVCRVLSDWMSIAYPDGSVKWVAKMEDVKDKIQKCKNSRRKPVRLRMSPF